MVNLSSCLSSAGSRGLDAAVKTHLAAVINAGSSQSSALAGQSSVDAGVSLEGYCSTGACYAQATTRYSHGNRRSNLAPIFADEGPDTPAQSSGGGEEH